MYFIPNLNEIESEMVPGNKNMTHNCAHSAQQAWTTHHEVAQHKGCYFGRHSKSTPKCATSAHRFLQIYIVGKQYVAHELEVDGGSSLCFVTYVCLVYDLTPPYQAFLLCHFSICVLLNPLSHWHTQLFPTGNIYSLCVQIGNRNQTGHSYKENGIIYKPFLHNHNGNNHNMDVYRWHVDKLLAKGPLLSKPCFVPFIDEMPAWTSSHYNLRRALFKVFLLVRMLCLCTV